MRIPTLETTQHGAALGPSAILLAAVVFAASIGAPGPALASVFDPDESPHSVQLYVPFNDRDVALGIEYDFRPPGAPRLSLFTLFAARPYHKRALERLRPHFALIYREVLYHGGAGLQVTAPICAGVSAHAGAGAAFVFGDFAGTSRAPDDGWTPLLRAGVTYAPPEVPLLMQAGYQHADLKSGGSSWAYFCAGVRF
jgi:hypothetical protein